MSLPFHLNLRSIPVILCLFACTACGQAGAPIPPEDVGIEAKVRKQKQQDIKKGTPEEGESSVEEESVTLPALRPVGTR